MASKSITKTFNYLSWFLIECKIIYYRPELFSGKFLAKMEISDHDYDRLERKYMRMCKLLKQPNTVQNMVEIDLNRPSVQLAIKRLQKVDLEIRTKKFTKCRIRNRLLS